MSGPATWEDGHTMSSHEDTAKRDTDSYVYSLDGHQNVNQICLYI